MVRLVWFCTVWYEEGGDTLSLQRDQLYGPSLLLSIVAIILLTMKQIGVDNGDDEKRSKAFFTVDTCGLFFGSADVCFGIKY